MLYREVWAVEAEGDRSARRGKGERGVEVAAGDLQEGPCACQVPETTH